MRKIVSLFLVFIMILLLSGCNGIGNKDLTDEKLAEVVADELGVQISKDITYEVGEKFFWEASDQYYKHITFYESGEIVASASVNSQNGELLKDIMKYSHSQ